MDGPRPGFKYCTYAHYLATLTVAELVDPATGSKRRCETVQCDLFYKDYRVKSALGTLDKRIWESSDLRVFRKWFLCVTPSQCQQLLSQWWGKCSSSQELRGSHHFFATLATAFLAASSRSTADVMGSPLFLRMFWASWTLVPSRGKNKNC